MTTTTATTTRPNTSSCSCSLGLFCGSMSCILALCLLLLVLFSYEADAKSCSFVKGNTTLLDCGWFGITKEQCLNRRVRGAIHQGCCFETSANPQCFIPPDSSCSFTTNRLDCGWFGITRDECETRGCCFNGQGVPACYFPKDSACLLEDRKDCGWSGITRFECEFKGCCFETSVAGKPQCFYRKPKPAPRYVSYTFLVLILCFGYVVYITWFDSRNGRSHGRVALSSGYQQLRQFLLPFTKRVGGEALNWPNQTSNGKWRQELKVKKVTNSNERDPASFSYNALYAITSLERDT